MMGFLAKTMKTTCTVMASAAAAQIVLTAANAAANASNKIQDEIKLQAQKWRFFKSPTDLASTNLAPLEAKIQPANKPTYTNTAKS